MKTLWNIIRELQTMATDLVVAEVEDEFYRADSED